MEECHVQASDLSAMHLSKIKAMNLSSWFMMVERQICLFTTKTTTVDRDEGQKQSRLYPWENRVCLILFWLACDVCSRDRGQALAEASWLSSRWDALEFVSQVCLWHDVSWNYPALMRTVLLKSLWLSKGIQEDARGGMLSCCTERAQRLQR